MALAALVGLAAVPIAMWRLTLTGQAMARVFGGEPFDALVSMLVLIAGLILLRAALQYLRDEISNATAAQMKAQVRALLYDHVLRLGAGYFDQRRTGDAVLALVDGEFTLKRYRKRGARVWLHPENPAFRYIEILDGMALEIWGVVTSSIRML